MMRTMSTVVMVGLLSACGGKSKEIDDPNMKASAETAGTQSAETAAMEPEAEDSTVEAQVQLLGSTFQTLVSQHQSYEASGSTSRVATFIGQAPPPSPDIAEGVSWDGTRLQANMTIGSSGISVIYLVDLSMTSTSMDGEYYLEYIIGAAGFGTEYTVSVVYDGVTTDGVSCITGGTLIIDYDLKVEALGLGVATGSGDQSGHIEVTYSGCNEATMSGY